MGDLIKRSDAIKAVREYAEKHTFTSYHKGMLKAVSIIADISSADRPQGTWEEKEAFHDADDNPIIEEWQSARCSICGKYHTTPYMYYFDNFNYCPHCGAYMKGADDEVLRKL